MKIEKMKNIGHIDQAIRIIVGLVMLSLVFVGPKTAWGYIGLIPLVTGWLGSCPLYSVLGIKTCPNKK